MLVASAVEVIVSVAVLTTVGAAGSPPLSAASVADPISASDQPEGNSPGVPPPAPPSTASSRASKADGPKI